ncbi:MAG: hypothetical protein AB1730_27970 [Myxococcota bacterium]
MREGPSTRARKTDIEARLHEARDEDDATWAVYSDVLEERGDSLAAWIRHGALADAARGGVLELRFGARAFLASAHLTRQAVVSAPGLAWHLAQLAALPVACFLRELGLALFAGAAPAQRTRVHVGRKTRRVRHAPGLRPQPRPVMGPWRGCQSYGAPLGRLRRGLA